MRFCIFSDVHGNLPALEALFEQTTPHVDGYICLGDVVNYGPWNDECLERILSLPNVSLIEGNHERLFLGHQDDIPGQPSPLVQEFLETSSQWFTRRDLLKDLPKDRSFCDYHFTHTLGSMRIYPNTHVELPGNFFVGHSHHQFRLDRANGTIVNCGSVGQSRQNGSIIAYAIWDHQTRDIMLHQMPYPVERFLRELRIRHYSVRCINYYQQLIKRGTL